MSIGLNQNNILNSNAPSVGLGSNSLTAKLLEKNLIDRDALEKLKVTAVKAGKSIEQILAEGKYISEEDLYKLKSEIYNVPYIRISEERIPVQVLNKFDQQTAQKNMAVPFEEDSTMVKVAMVDPLDLQIIKYLGTKIGKRVEPFYATPTEIQTIIDTRYGAQMGTDVDEAMEDVGEVVSISSTFTESADLQSDITSAPVARIVNMILEYAVKYKASDVHIEPRESRIVVRYRVSGVLNEKLTLPRKLGGALVSRIKILSNLKIDEHRVPQDGRFQIKFDNDVIDLRISIIPAVYGEKVVIRLLEKSGHILPLEKTGLRGRNDHVFREGLKKTQGIVLVTGPTGSGKTVTLAASLFILNKPEVNIMTLEDPVEIRMEGITQVQVNSDVGLTFAKGLRSFLRQDPDIIMVGEIRDKETAELAVQASLTGHLVLATLHTNNAAGALPRLIDMGIEPFLLSSTVNVIAAQRLPRQICSKCKTTYQATPEELGRLKSVLSSISGFDFESYLQKNGGRIILSKGQGCPQCGESGYQGRIGIFEVFKLSDALSAITVSGQSAQHLEKQAISEGMTTMTQDGFLKALEGITTIEEVLRVIS